MQCIICSGRAEYYFTKYFAEYAIGNVEYWRCVECGFTFSKTHWEMDDNAWRLTNKLFHEEYFCSNVNLLDQRWISRLHHQSDLLADAVEIGLLPNEDRWLDYGCGDGKLAQIIMEHHDLLLLKYDEYITLHPDYLSAEELKPGAYGFVITTSVFEHIRTRAELDFIDGLVCHRGIMGIHTLVRAEIPQDKDWFYLHPVHCAFFTNESMRRLLLQWGYSCSVYNVDARLWLCFRQESSKIEAFVYKANQRPNKPTYIFKEGFVNYWR